MQQQRQQLNQQRNDSIEELDDWIAERLLRRGVVVSEDATMNTETPGSVIDRLSILALRIYHLEEQATRDFVTDEHVRSVQARLAVCRRQRSDLVRALSQLIDDIEAGMGDIEHLRFRDREKGIHAAISLLEEGDCLLLLGKGHETYQLIGTEKLPFDERAIVESALEELV